MKTYLERILSEDDLVFTTAACIRANGARNNWKDWLERDDATGNLLLRGTI